MLCFNTRAAFTLLWSLTHLASGFEIDQYSVSRASDEPWNWPYPGPCISIDVGSSTGRAAARRGGIVEIVADVKWADVPLKTGETELNLTSKLTHLKASAQKALNAEISHAWAVVSMDEPTSYITALKTAGSDAGLDVVRVSPSSTGLLSAYGILEAGLETNIVLLDVGASHVEVTLYDKELEELGTSVDRTLGGRSLDKVVEEWMAEIRVPEEVIWRDAEEVKEQLSVEESVEVKAEGGLVRLTKVEYERRSMETIGKVVGLVERVIEEPKVGKTTISHIFLAGGASQTPQLHTLLRERFGSNITIGPDSGTALDKARLTQLNPRLASVNSYAHAAGQLSDDYHIDEMHDQWREPCPRSLGMPSPLVNGTPGSSNSIIIVTVFFPFNVSLADRGTTVGCSTARVKPGGNEFVLQFNDEKRKVRGYTNRDLGNYNTSTILGAVPGATLVQLHYEINDDGIFTLLVSDKNKPTIPATPILDVSGCTSLEELGCSITASQSEVGTRRAASLASFTSSLDDVKDQIVNPDRLGSKITADDKATVLAERAYALGWILGAAKEGVVGLEEIEVKREEVENIIKAVIEPYVGRNAGPMGVGVAHVPDEL